MYGLQRGAVKREVSKANNEFFQYEGLLQNVPNISLAPKEPPKTKTNEEEKTFLNPGSRIIFH